MQLEYIIMRKSSLIPRLHSLAFLHGARKIGEWSLGTRLLKSCVLVTVPVHCSQGTFACR